MEKPTYLVTVDEKGNFVVKDIDAKDVPPNLDSMTVIDKSLLDRDFITDRITPREVRVMVVDDVEQHINQSVMKELTGDDVFYARPLYADTEWRFESSQFPPFKGSHFESKE